MDTADVPTTENKVASIVNQILAGLIEGTGEAAVEAALVAQNPWLALPFVKQIFEFVLNKVGAILYKEVALAATKIIIDAQINVEEGSVNTAFQDLQMAVAGGDTDAIAKASSDLSAAYAALIHYDGSASP